MTSGPCRRAFTGLHAVEKSIADLGRKRREVSGAIGPVRKQSEPAGTPV
jgi:hypothetical protein